MMSSKKPTRKTNPLVSVNIPTYNSERTLGKALASIKHQTYPRIEVVVADGGSQDQTLSIAQKAGARVCFAKELGRARFKAYTQSKGDYILFFDSDQVLPPTLIAKCVEKCQKAGCDALTLSEKSYVLKGTLVEKLVAYDKQVIDSLKDDDAVFGDAVPRFFKSEILKKITWPKRHNVFDHTGIHLEILKKGAKVDYLGSPSIRHHEPNAWRSFYRKFFRYGYYYPQAFKDYPGPITAHSFPRRAYFTKAALSRPHYFLGLLLLYLVKGIAAALGVASYLLKTSLKKK